MYIIYKHTNKTTNESYIGYTSKTMEERAGPDGANYLRTHGSDNRYMHPAFANAIIKHGWNNFTHEVLEEVETLEEAKQKEKEYIVKYNSKNNGYNCTEGGEDCQDPDVREKVKQSWHSNPENAEKARKQITELRQQPGFIENMKAHNWQTQEQYERASERMKKQNADPDYQEKCRQGYLKFISNEENREKTKRNIQEKCGKQVICNTTGEIYPSIAEAARANNMDHATISMCCNGKLKTSGTLPDGTRLTWSFYEKGGDC